MCSSFTHARNATPLNLKKNLPFFIGEEIILILKLKRKKKTEILFTDNLSKCWENVRTRFFKNEA
jgi:hypothetical protein